MPVNPSSLPEGLYQVRFDSSGHEYVVVLRDGRFYGPSNFWQRSPEEWSNPFSRPDRATPLVPVPAGMTRDEAVKVLDDSHPEAELIAAMAGTLAVRNRGIESGTEPGDWRDMARAALAVVREHEARS